MTAQDDEAFEAIEVSTTEEPVIEVPFAEIPDPMLWQDYYRDLDELDLWSGVGWHPASEDAPVPRKRTIENQKEYLRRVVASWVLSSDGKYTLVNAPQTRLTVDELERLLPQMLAKHVSNKLDPKAIKVVCDAVIMGRSVSVRSKPRAA